MNRPAIQNNATAGTIVADQLLIDMVSSRVLSFLYNRLAPLNFFSKNFSDFVGAPRTPIRVPLVKSVAPAKLDPKTFSGIGKSEVGKRTVRLRHIYQEFGLTYDQQMKGIDVQDILDANLDSYSQQVWDLVTEQITSVYGSGVTIKGRLDPDSEALSDLWAGLPNSISRGLILNTNQYSGLIPRNLQALPLETAGHYGFERGIRYVNNFNASPIKGLEGFSVDSSAMAVASGLPTIDESLQRQMSIFEMITIPQLNFSVYFTRRSDPNTREVICSFEGMFGATRGVTDGTLVPLINSAATPAPKPPTEPEEPEEPETEE